MKAALILAAFAAATGFFARPHVENAAIAYVETCDFAPLPDRAGRYRPRGPICRLADALIYGLEPLSPLETRAIDCRLAALAPTDGAIEACTGEPFAF